MDPFQNMIRFPITFPKKSVKFPKSWQKLQVSTYKDESNFAILTGKINDIIVIDLDIKGSDKSLDWFVRGFGEIDSIDTLHTKSVNGGYHVFYKWTPLIKSTALKEYNVDILSDRKCCFGGNGYSIIGENTDIKELNKDQLDYLCKQYKQFKQPKNNEQNMTLFNKNLEIHTDIESKNNLSENQIQKILDGLSINRIDNREDWLRIGYFLSNYTGGKQMFDSWSKRSSKYNPERHEYDWQSIIGGKSDISIGTLMMFLKEDNPKLFNTVIKHNKIINELNEVTVPRGIRNTTIKKLSKKKIELDCDVLIKEIDMLHDAKSKNCRGKIIVGSCDNGGYCIECKSCKFIHPPQKLIFDKYTAPTIFNTLIINNTSDDIANKDTSQVAKIFKQRVKLLYVPKQWYIFNTSNGIYELQREEDILILIDSLFENDDEEWAKWIKKIDYKEKLLKELRIQCIIPKNISLDYLPNLLGFSNGVYDLDKSEFRIGLECEYVSMICKYPFDIEQDTTLAKEVLGTTFSNFDERVFAINRFSLILLGLNREQTMTFNYGFTASNGKSFLMERICSLLGNYGDSFNVNLLTNKMSSAGDANSTLVNFKNKRFMYCSEPESGAKLNTNFVKMLTGDVIKARGLYSQTEESIKPTYNIFVCCNSLPEFDTYDEGIARRIKLIEYNTKFTDNPKRKNEQFIKNYNSADLENIERGLLKIFIDNYKQLTENDFKYTEPEQLTTLKKLYINTNKNDIQNILIEKLELSANDNDFIKLKDAKNLLKSNNISKDNVSIKYIIQDIFPNSTYYERKMINNTILKSVFINLKSID